MVQNKETTYGYRWVILGVLWLTFMVAYMSRLSIGPLAPFFKEELGITSAQVGLVMSAAAAGHMVTLFLGGWLADKIGIRRPIVVGELIAGTAMIALFFAPSYTWLLTLMFAVGLGSGSLSAATTKGVIIWFPLRERATVMGLKQTSVNIGGVITAATLPAVALAFGWHYGFLFLGVAPMAVGIIALILYKEPPKPALSSVADSADPKAVPLLELLKSREIWLVALSSLCLAWVEMAAITHLVLYLTQSLFFSVIAAGGLLAMAEAAGAIARPGSGLLSDRVFGGNRKPVFMLMAGCACATSLLLGLFGQHLSWAIYPILFLLGLGGIGYGGIYLTLISEFGGRHGAGKAAGLGGTVAINGVMFGPVVFGSIVDISGSYEWAWLSLAFVAALCILLLLFVREEKRRI